MDIVKCRNCGKTIELTQVGWRHKANNLYQCSPSEVRLNISGDYVAQPQTDAWGRTVVEKREDESIIADTKDFREDIGKNPFAASIANEIRVLEEKAKDEREVKVEKAKERLVPRKPTLWQKIKKYIPRIEITYENHD